MIDGYERRHTCAALALPAAQLRPEEDEKAQKSHGFCRPGVHFPEFDAEAVCPQKKPFHRGKTTMVWQTLVRSEAGKLCAVVTQTQMVLPAPVNAER